MGVVQQRVYQSRVHKIDELKHCLLQAWHSIDHNIITGSITRSATRWYLIYSEADFEVFRPTGATRCTDWGEIWHGGGSPLHAKPNFTPIGATVRV